MSIENLSEAPQNQVSYFLFPKVSPPNQTDSVLEAFPLLFEPSLPNPFRGLQGKYSSLHNTWAWFLSLLPIRRNSSCVWCAFVWPWEGNLLSGWPKFVFWWHLNALPRNTLGESSVYISTVISGLTHLVNQLWPYAIAYPSMSMGTWLGSFYWIVWSNLPLQSRTTIFRRYNFFMRISSHKWFLASFHLIKKK